MGLLDEFFSTESYDHPRLRFWMAIVQKPNTAPPTIEVVREFDGLSFGPTTLRVTFSDLAGSPIQQYPEPWEARLDLALMEQGWRATSQQNEAVRIDLALKHLFSSAESRFGDGFFSSVLVKFVAQSAFAKAEAVKQLLSLIREPTPSKDSQFVGDCEQMEAMARIAALVPPPRRPLLRYHGVLAPGSPLRSRVAALRDRTHDHDKPCRHREPQQVKPPAPTKPKPTNTTTLPVSGAAPGANTPPPVCSGVPDASHAPAQAPAPKTRTWRSGTWWLRWVATTDVGDISTTCAHSGTRHAPGIPRQIGSVGSDGGIAGIMPPPIPS